MDERLFEYPRHEVVDGTDAILAATMERWQGILPVPERNSGRTFCTPGERIRLKEYYLDDFSGVGLDEEWSFCTIPINTGIKLKSTGKPPFREGLSHVITPDNKLVFVEDLIQLNPKQVIGTRLEEYTRGRFKRPTYPAVSKIFDNKNPIPHHLHFNKWEVHDPHQWLNPTTHPSHHHTTAMGLYQWVTPAILLNALKKFDTGHSNCIRSLSPAVWIPVGHGTTMLNGIFHAPTHLATHELHDLMDEHLLLENITLDGTISTKDAFGAVRAEDYPPDRLGDWEYFVHNCVDWSGNQNPDFVRDNLLDPLPAPEHSGDGVQSTWIVYGLIDGEQKCSILRVRVAPGGVHTFHFDSPWFFFTEAGRGKVGGLDVEVVQKREYGSIHFKNGFVTEDARTAGVTVINTGHDELVLTFDFAQNAHKDTPGVFLK